MEGMLILLAIVFAGLVLLGVPVALVRQGALQRQINELKRDLALLAQESRGQAKKPAPAKAPAKADAPSEPDPVSKPAPSPERKPAQIAAEATQDKAARTSVPAASAPRRRPEPEPEPEQPQAFVFTQSKIDALGAWLRENWVLAIAAASLAFAGVFMVQYGIENGVLTPFWRVMAALGFGAALVAAGEVLRRRFGDETEDATRHLPSVLSGAGVITLFAGVLSARVLYDMIGANTALAGLVAVSVFAMVLGWFYGPLLAAVGIIGAMAAPFVLSTGAGAPPELYYYFVLVILMGLGIDAARRWAWISVLALVLGLAAIWLLFTADTGTVAFAVSMLVVTLATIAIPVRSLVPNHAGAALWEAALPGSDEKRRFADFPTRLSGGVVAVASLAGAVILLGAPTAAEAWIGILLLVVLIAALAIWAEGAKALFDQTLVPAGALLVGLTLHGLDAGALVTELMRGLPSTDPEVNAPNMNALVYSLVGIGAFVTLTAFWRMSRAASQETAGQMPLIWAFASAVFAPAMFLILEFVWPVRAVMADYPWALTAILLAALMTLLAERCARTSGTDGQLKARIGLFALAALTLVAMSLFLILTKTALSLSLAAMIVLIVMADRKFDIPLLGPFVQLGAAVITYRLIADPGVFWAVERATALDAFIAYAGVFALLALAWRLMAEGIRAGTRLAVEATAMMVLLAGIFVLMARLFEDDLFSHWGMGLFAMLWGAAALAQIYRLSGTTTALHRALRWSLVAVFGGLTSLALFAQLTVLSPLASGWFDGGRVIGPPIFDSLMVGYLFVAALFAFAGAKIAPEGSLRKTAYVLASVYGAFYLVFEIRRIFRGRDLSVPGVTDGELYAYTLALLIGSIVLLLIAYKRRSITLRKIAMAGVALTIAKVFLVDMSGLSGLTRVFSFMGLGLALLGLTWLNRKLSEGWDEGGDTPDPAPDTEPEPEAAEPEPEPEAEKKPVRKARSVRPKKDEE